MFGEKKKKGISSHTKSVRGGERNAAPGSNWKEQEYIFFSKLTLEKEYSHFWYYCFVQLL